MDTSTLVGRILGTWKPFEDLKDNVEFSIGLAWAPGPRYLSLDTSVLYLPSSWLTVEF